MKSKQLFIALTTFILSVSLYSIGTKAPSSPSERSSSITALKEVSDGFSEVADRSIPAVVSIKAYFEQPEMQDPFYNEFFNHFFGPQPQNIEPAVGYGSGFFITQDGYILTNNHLVKDSKRLEVTLQDGSLYDAKVIGSDPNTEVALIKVEGKDFPFLTLANSDHVKVGQWAIAIGNPFEFEASVTVGIVSAKGRSTNGNHWENYIQTDAPINPGNSGGPLLNIYGEVIGINTAILSKTGGYMGIGFAIPSNMAEYIADQYYQHGRIERGYLGVMAQRITPDFAEALKINSTNGFVIVEIAPGSPAQKAGLKDQDIIIKLNGNEFTNKTNLTHEISLIKPGTKVNLTINRDGKVKEVAVTIGDYPVNKIGDEQTTQNVLGIEVENLTDDYAKRFGYENQSGVLVTKVNPRSKMAMASIKPGTLIISVNRNKVSNVAEFYKELDLASQNKNVLLLVRYGKMSRYVTININ